METDHAGRRHQGAIHGGRRQRRGMRRAVKAAIAHGWLTMHPSGGYLMFTQTGADLMA
jgi:hypothetical protein